MRIIELYKGASTLFRATLRTLVPLVLSLPACSALGVVGFSGIGVTVDPTGSYSVTVPDTIQLRLPLPRIRKSGGSTPGQPD